MRPRFRLIVPTPGFARALVAVVLCGSLFVTGGLLLRSDAKSVEEANKNFPLRLELVELNGFCQRMIGQRHSNERVLYNGDILEHPSHPGADISWHVGELVKWNAFARDIGAGYLYVLAPMKLDRKLEMLPSGFDPREHDVHATADELLERLAAENIAALDLRPGLCDDLAAVKRNFFRTDHHWRYEAVMAVMPVVARRIAEVAGRELPADAVPLVPENWGKHAKRACFLGSAGRRVGGSFAGYDDFAWYTPKFKTRIGLEVPSRNIRRRGPFEKSVLVSNCLNKGRDLFYSSYIGGQYDVFKLSNPNAPCSARVAFIADSYARPMAGLLSTVFREIVVLDPRRYKQGLFAFVRDYRPDAVVTFLNMKYYQREFYEFSDGDHH